MLNGTNLSTSQSEAFAHKVLASEKSADEQDPVEYTPPDDETAAEYAWVAALWRVRSPRPGLSL